MAKEKSMPHLHQDYYSAMYFGYVISEGITRIRQSIDGLRRSRKPDSGVTGAVHAIRKLCDGEEFGGYLKSNLDPNEVAEWEEVFTQWFKRVQRHYDEDSRVQFKEQLESDFRVLRAAAQSSTLKVTDAEKKKQRLILFFDSSEQRDAAFAAAAKRHPVDVGNAFGKYIERWIKTLVSESAPVSMELQFENQEFLDAARIAAGKLVSPAGSDDPLREYLLAVANSLVDGGTALPAAKSSVASADSPLCPQLHRHDDGQYSVTLSDWCGLLDDEFAESDHTITGYDLESAVKLFLQDRRKSYLEQLEFDCESSGFCVRASNAAPLTQVIDILFRFFSDDGLRRKYLKPESLR